MRKRYNVAVAGATGIVGRRMLSILSERAFPVGKIWALASRGSAGKEVSYGTQRTLRVEALDDFDFGDCDFVFASCGGRVSAAFADEAIGSGTIVIDNSSHFRMDPDVPLIVPEVNGSVLESVSCSLIANPNCSTIQMVMVLGPLHRVAVLRRVHVASYQSVSGAGKAAMDALFRQTRATLTHQSGTSSQVFSKDISFNVIPHIDTFEEDGSTREEQKMRQETRKILEAEIEVSAFCVRAPVFVGHALAVFAFFAQDITPSEARAVLRDAPGVFIIDKRVDGGYITPRECAGKDEVYISRIRQNPDDKKGLIFWVVADNLRKGAALNAIQIAELVLTHIRR